MKEKLFNLKESSKRQWMVVYTRSRFEKRIDKDLKERGFTSFCPVVTSQNKWADRVKTVETPLFSSYVFVKVNQFELTQIRQTTGVISFVTHCGRPVTLNDSEIDRIEMITKSISNVEIVSINSINIGDKVKIKDGLLLNVEGVVERIMGKLVLMAIEPLDCALVVKVSLDQLALNVAS